MFFFRVDIGPGIGLGHYSRITNLIQESKIKKYKIFIDKNYNNFLKKKNKETIELYNSKNFFLNEVEDAKLFSKYINRQSTVILDSYKLGYSWEKIISKNCKKLYVIDDFIERKHFADAYINYSPIFLNDSFNYIEILRNNNKKKCKFFLGPEYAMFRKEVINKRNLEEKKKIVTFYNGASGSLLLYKNIINQLVKQKNIIINIIVGPYSKENIQSFNYFNRHKNINIISNKFGINKIITSSKVFITSASVAAYESAYYKVPTLVIKMNKTQNLNYELYEKIGHFFYLEKIDLNKTKKVSKLIYLLLNNYKEIKKIMKTSKLKLGSKVKEILKTNNE